MRNRIEAIKLGNVVNIFFNGIFHKKNCGTPEEANELYSLAQRAKENPFDDELIREIRLALNERLRIAFLTGLEHDPDTGEVFLAGFNTPLPETLVEVIKDYHENGYPMEAIINFWKLLMINPDKRVRTSLFQFIQTHDFVLTSKGYMVVYKAVAYKERVDNDYAEFISKQYIHVKQDWSCSPNKYVVYRRLDDNSFGITKASTAEEWDEVKMNIQFLGKLGDLNAEIDKLTVGEDKSLYTDKHTHTMDIQLGVPVYMDRTECDSDPAIDCSYGLHVGATKYVESFGSDGDAVLVCLVNPAHVVAVPNYDHSKMRVAEYFPFAIAEYVDGKIKIIEEKYFENDYADIEQDELDELVEVAKGGELPIRTAKKAEAENRPFPELIKMLESRLVDLQ